MTLSVEVAGFGLCQKIQPYSIFVICVLQESVQAWTVYRKYSTFATLAEEMATVSEIPLPKLNGDSMSCAELEVARVELNKWLQEMITNPVVLRTQSMYQFLCADANMQPPFLEVHWRKSDGEADADEMEMDDMFGEDGDEDEDGELDARHASVDSRPSDGASTVWGFASSSAQFNMKVPSTSTKPVDQTEGEEDGLDIKSLSVVEAEFLYNRQEVEECPASYQEQRSSLASALGTGAMTSSAKRVSLESFFIIKVIGKGSFGKVFLVREKASETLFAMKVLKKDYIMRKNQVEHTKTERSVLGYLHHPYIVGLQQAFQTADKLFFVLDYCAGGELFFQLGKVGRFPEDRARFYSAQITLALEYMHSLDIVYRDLKPENVLLDEAGNVRLTDFGLSKEGVNDSVSGATSFCGTPEYIAPEVLNRKGHGRAVDWWSLGALLYEMLSGLPPFYSRNRETMFEKIMKAELTFPSFMGPATCDVLTKLLQRDPRKRLGSGPLDANEIKQHPFFAGMDWKVLASGKAQTPWQPTVSGSLDTSQFDQEFTSMMPIVSPDVREGKLADRSFEGFSFVDDSGAEMIEASRTASVGSRSERQLSLGALSGSSATVMATSFSNIP
jgi:serine/threonine protein kinase